MGAYRKLRVPTGDQRARVVVSLGRAVEALRWDAPFAVHELPVREGFVGSPVQIAAVAPSIVPRRECTTKGLRAVVAREPMPHGTSGGYFCPTRKKKDSFFTNFALV